MNTSEPTPSILGTIGKGYDALFGKQWAAWVAGILLAVANILLFAYQKPWSAADGVRNWGDWVFNTVGLADKVIISPYLYSTSLLNFGVIGGAFAAALLAGQFRVQGAPPFELLKGLVGGILMGVGAAMAFGCNIGGFFSATSALSLAGLAMMAGLMIGVYIGLRLLILEVTHLDFAASAPAPGAGKRGILANERNQKVLGMLVLASGLVVALLYDGFDYSVRAGFLLFGLVIGVIMQRSRFCFVKAFREPFLTGDGEMTKAVILAVFIGVLGFSILKWTDLKDWDAQVSSAFWMGSLLGGIVFGVGMSISGGCATGCLWRAGEGQIKLWVAIAAFSLSGALFRGWLEDSGWLMKLGEPVFLPEFMSWKMSIATVLGTMLLWYLLVVWNEAKKRLVVAW
ncbi:MAG: YeeE/YedE thiosulfate transporter family protein [Gammaproteobacteria bacterium]|nr:YeeE/YedE thiosulfate transporter family protein [Gammaproteobacteria bacterium]